MLRLAKVRLKYKRSGFKMDDVCNNVKITIKLVRCQHIQVCYY